jgi:enamine deaminase RidA (YjgF/YER057c/UK114 family)
MKKQFTFSNQLSFLSLIITMCFVAASCNHPSTQTMTVDKKVTIVNDEKPEYYNFRPALEKEYGYTHAVKIGNHIKISGAVSMDDRGILIAPGNLEQQMKNCYSDLEKILAHYGCSFDDVYAENIYTTDMAGLEKILGFRNSIYKKQFPTGTWLEVKGLALTGQLIEIDMEALKGK